MMPGQPPAAGTGFDGDDDLVGDTGVDIVTEPGVGLPRFGAMPARMRWMDLKLVAASVMSHGGSQRRAVQAALALWHPSRFLLPPSCSDALRLSQAPHLFSPAVWLADATM
jgi:hypothetical protein